MANIYTKSMREALQEARDFRDTNEIEELDIEEGTGHLEYDEWLKKEKGIAKGAHGINSDEHAKYSAEWRAYVKGLFDNLPPIKKEGGERTYPAISGTGSSRGSNRPQAFIPLKINPLDRFTGGKSGWSKVASWLKNALITFGEEVELTEEDADKLMNLMNDGLNEIVGGQGHMTVTKDGGVAIIKTKDWQTYKAKGWVKKTNESLDLSATGDTATSNASQEVEGEELTEAWNEKLSKKGLEQYRTMYKSLSKSGIDTKWIKALEKLYDDIVIGGMYSSVSAEREGILKIDGRTKYKNANW